MTPEAGVPRDRGEPPPDPVVELAAGRPIRPVWANELGGVTYQLGQGPQRQFLKWAPAGSGVDLVAEAVRMRWAHPYTPVPRVLATGGDGAGQWLLTSGLPGDSAVSDRWKAEPATAVATIGEGLRALHDALPVDECPFSWSARDRVATARQRAAAGDIDPSRWDPDHRGLDLAAALAVAAAIPDVDRLVVCHGDACAPNTLIGEDGGWSGHVDLGDLGVADRWADLAIATWSTVWNYGPGWEDALLSAYGVAPDPERTRYYRLLWDLGP